MSVPGGAGAADGAVMRPSELGFTASGGGAIGVVAITVFVFALPI